MKEQKDATKEAFNGTAFAQFLFGPSRWQAGAVLLTFGIPGDDRHGSKRTVDPGDETQPPIACIQADEVRANVVEGHGPRHERAGKGRIMDVGGRKQKEDRQARATTEQGMHAIAA